MDSSDTFLTFVVLSCFANGISKIYNIEKSMATFTMVQVLKSQQHYNQALAVLDVLQSLGHDNNKIIHERDEILQSLSESQK